MTNFENLKNYLNEKAENSKRFVAGSLVAATLLTMGACSPSVNESSDEVYFDESSIENNSQVSHEESYENSSYVSQESDYSHEESVYSHEESDTSREESNPSQEISDDTSLDDVSQDTSNPEVGDPTEYGIKALDRLKKQCFAWISFATDRTLEDVEKEYSEYKMVEVTLDKEWDYNPKYGVTVVEDFKGANGKVYDCVMMSVVWASEYDQTFTTNLNIPKDEPGFALFCETQGISMDNLQEFNFTPEQIMAFDEDSSDYLISLILMNERMIGINYKDLQEMQR